MFVVNTILREADLFCPNSVGLILQSTINIDDAVYVAIFTSDKTRVDQILQLIGNDNVECTDYLEDNFFAWMFWKYDRDNRQINSDIGLPAMNAFSGTIQRDDLQDMIM